MVTIAPTQGFRIQGARAKMLDYNVVYYGYYNSIA